MNTKLKPSEFMFSFPIRLRSQTQLDEAERMKDLLNHDVQVDYVEGKIVLPIEDIIGWQDSFSKEISLEDIREHGFDLTIVETLTLQSFVCTWNRRTFEEKYNNHIIKLEKYLDEQEENKYEEEDENSILISLDEYKELLTIEHEYNKPWYKKLFKNK